jgi:hypothetical protein
LGWLALKLVHYSGLNGLDAAAEDREQSLEMAWRAFLVIATLISILALLTQLFLKSGF